MYVSIEFIFPGSVYKKNIIFIDTYQYINLILL